MFVHVLLYQVGTKDEGIHSIDLKGKTIVLMFEDIDDAERYCGLLDAQDFPVPKVEIIEKSEIENFCYEAGYESRFVKKGFIPQSEEDRLLISPPVNNIDSQPIDNINIEEENSRIPSNKLDLIKKQLENLL